MYCGQCGSPNQSRSRFCGQCGAALPEQPTGSDISLEALLVKAFGDDPASWPMQEVGNFSELAGRLANLTVELNEWDAQFEAAFGDYADIRFRQEIVTILSRLFGLYALMQLSAGLPQYRTGPVESVEEIVARYMPERNPSDLTPSEIVSGAARYAIVTNAILTYVSERPITDRVKVRVIAIAKQLADMQQLLQDLSSDLAGFSE